VARKDFIVAVLKNFEGIFKGTIELKIDVKGATVAMSDGLQSTMIFDWGTGGLIYTNPQ